MSKGLSPIIATMLLIAITISIAVVASIWMQSQSQEYMNAESEHREQILNREGESLVLVHVTYDTDSRDLILTLQNNGTSDLTLAYVKVDQLYFSQGSDQGSFTCSPDCSLETQTSATATVRLTTAYTAIERVRTVEVGTMLGRLFAFNAPSPQIRISSTFFDINNKIVTFSAEGSVDDGKIVKWEWCFDYDEITGESCECMPGYGCVAGESDNRAYGHGIVVTYNYQGYTTDTTYIVWLKVTDDTGMVGYIELPITIPEIT